MALSDFKKDLVRRIPADIQEVLRILDRHIKPESPRYKDILLLNGRYSDVQREARMGTLDMDEKWRQFSKVREALVDVVNAIQPEDMREHKDFRILVVCKDDTDKEYMQQYIDALPLSAKVIRTDSYVPPNEFALIVFDAHSLGAIPKFETLDGLNQADKRHIELLKAYLEKAPKYLLYFGEFNFILNQYREITNAANNKFSLYARIKEMKDFMEEYQVGRERT